ncbi:hypothetical protein AAFN60_19370 [Roseibacillus persicicus]|uniref:hypothetical protein n=1 Tax=Roseibacillus persicicus TaxID=454148 RepID=UPI00398A5211
MKEPRSEQQETALRKYNASLFLSMIAGVVASGSVLFGQSLKLSLMAIIFGVVVGAVTYIFFLCLMILLGFFLRGKFGQAISNPLCWAMLLLSPVVTGFVTTQVAGRF